VIEVNPRYPASVEVLEHATGRSALALHRSAFEQDASEHPTIKKDPSSIVGKAILFARSPLQFPKEGSWLPALDPARPIHELPSFADIPCAGEIIEAGKPILTLFARAATVAECGDSLRRKAAALDSSLFAT